MSTEPVTTPVPDQTASPAESSLAAMLYGSETDPATASPDAAQTPAETTGTDSSTPAVAATSTPEVSPTPEPPTTGTEELDPAKKQLADQTAANKRLGREMAELREAHARMAEDNKILQAKLDGTHEEPVKPTPEEAAQRAVMLEREAVSKVRANELYGEDVVAKRVYDKGSDLEAIIQEEVAASPFRRSPTYLAIMADKQPAIKAMRILQTRDFGAKWGEDPTKWEEKILTAAKPKILAELKTQLAAAQDIGGQPRSVSEGRGAGGQPGKKEKTMAELLYGR